MKKIFRVASYDFKRLVLNPITSIIFIVILTFCLILGAVIKIPTTPAYEANINGTTASQIQTNFLSSSETQDTKNNLDKLLNDAQSYITNQTKGQCFHASELDEINKKFKQAKAEILKFNTLEDCIYLEEGLNDVYDMALLLNNFLERFENYDALQSNVIMTTSQFEKLKANNLEILNKIFNQTGIENQLTDLSNNIYLFEEISTILDQLYIYNADIEILNSLNIVVEKANQKTEDIQNELTNIVSKTGLQEQERLEKAKSLVTNYKLTCESAKKIVEITLRISIEKHFHNLNNLQNFELFNLEEEKIALAKANYFLDSKDLYYSQNQQPLNFYSASYEVSLYDYAYTMTAIIGFLLCLFAIFLAYKLFGRDRKAGKMDIILSQNISYNQVFAGKFLAIVFTTAFFLLLFASLSLLWGTLFYPNLPNSMLAVFNLSSVYNIAPLGFFFIKILGIELQAIFWALLTIFIMNLSRKFELNFAITLVIFAIATVCNIFLNNSLVYCLFPFIHIDLTSYLGGATMTTGFLKTSLYAYGNFYISLAYYLVMTIFLYSFTRQLFKKN